MPPISNYSLKDSFRCSQTMIISGLHITCRLYLLKVLPITKHYTGDTVSLAIEIGKYRVRRQRQLVQFKNPVSDLIG